jgi:glycosyltransferase involved in cell wall biosynthesis
MDETPYLCFAAQDWWYHNQAHSDFQLMRQVAQTRPVLVINSLGLRMPTARNTTQPLRRVARKAASVARLLRAPLPELPNFHVMSPLAWPGYGDARVEAINGRLVAAQVRWACARLGIHRPVGVVTLPTAEPVLRFLDLRLLVAYRSDKHSNFAEADSAVVADHEERLIERSDHVLYSSHALMDDERALSHGKGVFFDHGVDIDHFVRRPSGSEPADLQVIGRPRVGFFGAVDDLVDLDVLVAVADGLPEADLVLVGSVSVSVEALARRPNVHLLGQRPYAEIPAYGSGFDVAIMPWRDNEWIRLCNPIKLKEYLALGLPVVSTPFAELEHYRDVVRMAAGPEAFVDQVRAALATTPTTEDRARWRSRVGDQTWSRRAAELINLCESPKSNG